MAENFFKKAIGFSSLYFSRNCIGAPGSVRTLTFNKTAGLCKVTIQDLKSGEKKTYKLLGKYEADPYAVPKVISDESPLGKALVGKKQGEITTFEIKNSKTKYKVLNIDKAL